MLSLHGLGGGRGGQYWDNAPRTRGLQTANVFAPHALTARLDYTPPAGQLAYMESIFLLIERQTAAGVLGMAQLILVFFPGHYGGVDTQTLRLSDNAVNARQTLQVSSFGLISDEDIFEVQTTDSSTGGTVLYEVFAKLTEFERQSVYTKY